jgi:hypothetical protein
MLPRVSDMRAPAPLHRSQVKIMDGQPLLHPAEALLAPLRGD